MKPTLHWFLPLLLLTACGDTGSPKDNYQTLSPGLNALRLQGDTTVKLPQSTWKVTGATAWLEVGSVNQYGMTYLNLTAKPLSGLQGQLQATSLTTTLTLTSEKGIYTVNVTYPLTKVSGQVPGAGAATAAGQLGSQSRTWPALTALSSQAGNIVVEWREAPDSLPLSAQGIAPLGAVTQSSVGGRAVTTFKVANVAQAVAAFKADSRVLRAFPVSKMKAQAFSTTDPLSPYQWYFDKLGFEKVAAEKPSQYPNAVTVAVVDSGVRSEHPDLSGRMYWMDEGALDLITDTTNGDFTGVDTDPTDPGGVSGMSHGTAVTGLIAARQDTVGIVGGVLDAPVKVLPIRVLGKSEDGDTTEIMMGVRYAAGEPVTIGGKTYTNPHPAQIINVSIGAPATAFTADEQAFICDAVSAATQRGSLVVVAAGNDSSAVPSFPAACSDALAVAALGVNAAMEWEHVSYSNTGSHIRIAAPGGDINASNVGLVMDGTRQPDELLTTNWNTGATSGNWALQQGTSFATPIVSAVAALMFSKGVVSTPQEAINRLISTATDVLTPGKDNASGYGIVNPVAALAGSVTAPQAYLATIREVNSAVVFKPKVEANGAWNAYLPGGEYEVQQGVDADGDGTLTAGSEIRQSSVVKVTDGIPVTLP